MKNARRVAPHPFFLVLSGAIACSCHSSESTTAAGSGGFAGTTNRTDGSSTGGTTSSGGQTNRTDGSSAGGTMSSGGHTHRDAGSVVDAGSRTTDGGLSIGASVLQHHNSPTRNGVYTDAAFTKTAVAHLHRDTTFKATIGGNMYAQLLFVDGHGTKKDVLFAATENDDVYAVDAATGAILWQKNVGTPAVKSNMPCGNIFPLGITGTPIIDLATRGIYFDALATTPDPMMDGGVVPKHLVYGLSIDDGHVLNGWPVSVSDRLSVNGKPFDATIQGQRGALAILNGVLYVPYGGYAGDCGVFHRGVVSNYHGVIVGFPLGNPSATKSWATSALSGGSWAPSGIASDETGLFAATGNTAKATTWGGGEAILHFSEGPAFDESPTRYFTPSNWQTLDATDEDLGSTGPVLFDLPGSNPSKLTLAAGKNGVVFLLDRTNLGGVGKGDGTTGEGLYSQSFSTRHFITAAAAYTTAKATYVVGKGIGTGCPAGSDLLALKVVPGSPPSLARAWCASQQGVASPIVTTTDGKSDAVVWGIGGVANPYFTGFDGDTGATVFSTTSAADAIVGMASYVTPIEAKGRLFVGAENAIYAFTLSK